MNLIACELELPTVTLFALSQSLEDLSLENAKLKRGVQRQWSRLDYMENQSSQRNILFHNIPKKGQNETRIDFERAVHEVI